MDLRELYQEVILDHNRHPRNRGHLDHPDHKAEGHNPLCGDCIEVEVRLHEGRVDDIAFEGEGCAISQASASLMTEAVKGKSLEEAEKIFRKFQRLATGAEMPTDEFDELSAFAGVKDYPVRIKCATLPWHTLNAALKGEAEASTE
ncbi:SUF system NifU family Fe-S cluster assembly protein [soil metagenome]